MENINDAEQPVNTSSSQQENPAASEKTSTDKKDQENKEAVAKSKKSQGSSSDFNFFVIEALDFHKTPQRNKELHRFSDVLKAPFINVPLLVVDRQEDILPVLSLYAYEEAKNKRKVSFFSVTPSDFGFDEEEGYSYDLGEKLDQGGTVIEYGEFNGGIPVYCDLLDYMDRDMFGKFVCNFLKTEMPAVLCVDKRALEDIRASVQNDIQISGGIEKPSAPYEAFGLARSKEIEISPLTREEKHIYFAHHIQRMAFDHGLQCDRAVCRYFVNQMIDRFPHENVFYKVFDLMNQIIVST